MRGVVLLLLLLVACAPTGADFSNSGTEGVTIEFTEGFPDTDVYENSPVPVSLEVKNTGTKNITYDRLLLSWSYDPLYLSNSAGSDVSFPIRGPVLHERSRYRPEGDVFYVEEFGFATNEVLGQREAPKTDLHALVCYEYATRFVKGICLDVDSYLKTGREQVCTGQDITASSQGAPVAFTKIEMRARPQKTETGFPAVSPEIVATLRNVGSGTVLAPPLTNFESACRLDLPSSMLNGMSVTGSLLGYRLYCEPAVVKFRDGEARVHCSFSSDSFGEPNPTPLIFRSDCSKRTNFVELPLPEQTFCLDSLSTRSDFRFTIENLYGLTSTGAFEGYRDPTNPLTIERNIMTVLALEARYIYRDSASHELTIHRNEFGTSDAYAGDAPIQKGYAYDSSRNLIRDGYGDPLTKCDYFVDHPEKAPADLINLNPEFSCACSRDECVEMDDFSFCAHGLCPGNFECCDKAAYESFKKAVSNEGYMGEDE